MHRDSLNSDPGLFLKECHASASELRRLAALEPPLRLSTAQLRSWDELGFLLLPCLLPAAVMERLRLETARLCAGARGEVGSGPLYDLEATHRPQEPRVRRVKRPDLHSETFRELLVDETVLGVMKQLLGTKELRHQNNKLNVKAAGYGAAVQWHQDWAFYPHTNESILAMGVFIDDVTAENGPLLVVPGSHKGPIYSHHSQGVFVGGIEAEEFGVQSLTSSAEALLAPAGSCSFHHVRLVHGSAPNRSTLPRRMLFTEVAAADAWPLATLPSPGVWRARLLCGDPDAQTSWQPRVEAVPVRLPFPRTEGMGSIYDEQSRMRTPSFEATHRVEDAASDGNGTRVSKL